MIEKVPSKGISKTSDHHFSMVSSNYAIASHYWLHSADFVFELVFEEYSG